MLYVTTGVTAAGVTGYYVSENVTGSAIEEPVIAKAPAKEESQVAALLAQPEDASDPKVVAPQESVIIPEILPEFSVLRVEPDGNAVIAGSAKPSSKIELLKDGEVIATTKTDGTGDFAFVLDEPFVPGSHSLSLRSIDENNTALHSAEAAFINVPQPDKPEELAVLVSEPGEATRILAKPKVKVETPKAVVLSTDVAEVEVVTSTENVDVTVQQIETQKQMKPVLIEAADIEDKTMFIAGTGEPGHIVNFYFGDDFIGSAKVADNGAYLFEGKHAVEPGKHDIRADMVAASTTKVLARAQVKLVHKPDLVEEPKPEVVASKPEVQTENESVTEDIAAAHIKNPDEETIVETGTAVIIRRGDNLWRVARRNYGAGIRYTTIYDANRDQLTNPNLIFPGQVLQVPEGQQG